MGGELLTLDDDAELLGDGLGEGLTELLELIDKDKDGRLVSENFLLLLVDELALGDGVLHLDDAVEFLVQGSEALVEKTEDGAIRDLRGLTCRHWF